MEVTTLKRKRESEETIYNKRYKYCLEDLDINLLYEIFSHLPDKDIVCTLPLVCKHYYHLLTGKVDTKEARLFYQLFLNSKANLALMKERYDSNAKIFGNLDVLYLIFNQLEDHIDSKNLIETCKFTRELQPCLIKKCEDIFIDPECLGFIPTFFPNRSFVDKFIEFAARLPFKIKNLCLNSWGIRDNLAFLYSFQDKLDQLKSLTLMNQLESLLGFIEEETDEEYTVWIDQHMKDFNPKFPALECLHIEEYLPELPHALEACLKGTKPGQIKTFIFGYVGRSFSKELAELMETYLSGLKSFSFITPADRAIDTPSDLSIDDEPATYFIKIVKKGVFKNLEYVKLGDSFSEHVFMKILNKQFFPYLRELHIIRHFKKIKHINQFLKNINLECLEKLSFGCTNLNDYLTLLNNPIFDHLKELNIIIDLCGLIDKTNHDVSFFKKILESRHFDKLNIWELMNPFKEDKIYRSLMNILLIFKHPLQIPLPCRINLSSKHYKTILNFFEKFNTSKLTSLTLSHVSDSMDGQVIKAIIEKSPPVKKLDFTDSRFSEDFLIQLISSPAVKSLKKLYLKGCKFSDRLIKAIKESPYLRYLKHLNCTYDSDLSQDLINALKGSPNLPRLRTISQYDLPGKLWSKFKLKEKEAEGLDDRMNEN